MIYVLYVNYRWSVKVNTAKLRCELVPTSTNAVQLSDLPPSDIEVLQRATSLIKIKGHESDQGSLGIECLSYIVEKYNDYI